MKPGITRTIFRLAAAGLVATGCGPASARAEIAGVFVDGTPLGFFTAVSGLGSSSDFSPTGTPQDGEFLPVRLQRTVTDDSGIAAWRQLVEQGQVDDAREEELEVIVFGEGVRQGAARWMLERAWPSRLEVRLPGGESGTGEPANAGGNEVAIEELTLVHEGFQRVVQPGDEFPFAALTAPEDGSIFLLPAEILLEVAISETVVGQIDAVRFFANEMLLGAATRVRDTGRFVFRWEDPPVGRFRITALVEAAGLGTWSTLPSTIVTTEGPGIALFPEAVDEHQPAGAPVGVLRSAGLGAGVTYDLADGEGSDDNAAFRIEGDLLVATREFDFEDQPLLRLRVKAGGDSASVEQAFEIAVRDLREGFLRQVQGWDVSEEEPAPGSIESSVQARFHVRPGSRHIVESSGTMGTWLVLGLFQADDTGILTVTESVPSRISRRFWRVTPLDGP